MNTGEQELRRRLLSHVVLHLDERVVRVARDAIVDLLTDAPDEMAEKLLAPIFARSDFWPVQMAKEILGLPSDDEYGCAELLDEFDAREQGIVQAQGDVAGWIDERF